MRLRQLSSARRRVHPIEEEPESFSSNSPIGEPQRDYEAVAARFGDENSPRRAGVVFVLSLVRHEDCAPQEHFARA